MRRIRIPLVGSYNTRIGATNALSGSSSVVGSAIVGTMVVGSTSGSTTDKDQRFINCFPSIVQNPVTGKGTVYLQKRPGFAANTTPQAGSIGNAILVWSGQGSGGKVISAFGATNSSIYDGTTQLVTNNGNTTIITGRATGITETVVGGGTATLLISSSDSTAWYYQDAGTVTKVSDADFPGNAGKTLAGTFAHLDGFAFIMCTDGNIYNSDLNSVTAWTANNYIPASAYPDLGVACVRWKNQIIGFGPQSMEFFRNGQTPSNSPLVRVADAAQKIGLCNANAVVNWRDQLFWAGSSPEGGLSIYTLADGVKRVSPPAIEEQLVIAGSSNISLSLFAYFGRIHLYVKASSSTFAYCVDSDAWYEIVGTAPLWTRSSAVSVGSNIVSYSVSNVSTSGKTYIINPSAYAFRDDSVAYTATCRTSPLDFGNNNRKMWQELALIADVETSTSEVSVAWTDDDYQSYSTARTLDLSAQNRRLYRLGSSRRRSFVFSHNANTPMRLEAMELAVEEART